MSETDMERVIEQKSVITWAFRNRKIRAGGRWQPYTIKDYPFYKGIFHALQSEEVNRVVLMKGTQLGATQAAITSGLYFLDVKAENVLYCLPSSSMVRDFSSSRLDKIIEQSPYLRQLFSNVSNVHLKVSPRGSLYLRGMRSSEKLEEVPVGYLIRDELSRQNQENARLARKRLGASERAWIFDLGHPLYEGDALSTAYNNSSRHKYKYTCPNCGELQELSFHANLYDRDGEFGCRACSQKFEKKDVINSGYWKAEGDIENPIRGFHLSRMYSPVADYDDLIRQYKEAKQEGSHKLDVFNQTVLGRPASSSGSKLSLSDVKKRETGPPMATSDVKNAIMGVDTGNVLHWSVIAGNRVLAVGKATAYPQLRSIASKYNVSMALLDAQPEMHSVESFIRNLPDYMKGLMVRTKGKGDITAPKIKKGEDEVLVHAVWAFDNLFDKFNRHEIVLPNDVPEEFEESMTAPVRLVEENAQGNPKPSYEKNASGQSHFVDSLKFAFVGNAISDRVSTPMSGRLYSDRQLEVLFNNEHA